MVSPPEGECLPPEGGGRLLRALRAASWCRAASPRWSALEPEELDHLEVITW
jgi:hypothetical protein